MSNTVEIWHLINGEYVHIVQVTDGTTRTYYTGGKKEGCKVDITGPMYAKRKYKEEAFTIKGSDFEREAKRAIR